MRNDHSSAGTTILQTTLEDADSTQFYWWLDKSSGKGSTGFHGCPLTMVLNTETSWSPNHYLYHRICPTINKIMYYQHLLVSFEELLSLRLSDHFALVVGCINSNWLNLWKKKMRVRCSQAFHFLSDLSLAVARLSLWISDHHQECPIRLGKFSRMRNYSISKTATAELGRARLACWSINVQHVRSDPISVASAVANCGWNCWWINWQRRLESWSSSSSLQSGWSPRMVTRWSSHHPACSIRYQSLHVSSSANDPFKNYTGAPLPSTSPPSHFSHGRQNRRSSFCRCRTVREEVRIWWQSRGLQSLCLPICTTMFML